MKLNVFLKEKCFVFGLALVFLLFGSNFSINAEKVTLTKNGVALHSVIVSSDASKRTSEAAKDLAEYLNRITGGSFVVTIGDGTEGIAIGTYKDFPQLGLNSLFNSKDPTRLDEYLLRTHDNGVYLVGATDLAAQHAVWGFLYQLGYRHFVPTDSWEIIPEESNLSVDLNKFEKPDFYLRDAPHISPYTDIPLWNRWHDQNRFTSSFWLNTSQGYNAFVSRNQTELNEHPEYLALLDGVRGGGREEEAKFCISNEGFRRMVVEDAKRRIEKDPSIMTIGSTPTDGRDYCECELCSKMGSISDRYVIMANEIAEGINSMGHGEKYVGLLAYSEYSVPPTIKVHPNVVIMIATQFIREGYTMEQLVEGWSKYASTLGIRDFHDVFKWSFSKPHEAHGGDINYLVEKIPYFYNNGARFFKSESSDSWVPNGLGYYLSAHLLWDVDAVNHVDELINDFVEKSFKEAKKPMRKFYNLINEDYATVRSNDDLLAHMYEYIKDARALTKDSKVHARLDDLTLYAKYLELWFKFEISQGKANRLKAAQDVYRHVYRMQNTMLVPVYSLYLQLRRSGVVVPKEANPRMHSGQKTRLTIGKKLEDIEPWKSSRLFTDDEIAQFTEDGVANYKKDTFDFKPVSFSENLVPAAKALGLPKVKTGYFARSGNTRGRQKRFTWFNSDNKQLNLEVTGGLATSVKGNVKLELLSPAEVLVKPVDTDESVLPDGEKYDVTLKSPYEGIHELVWDDGGDVTKVAWAENTPMTVRSSVNDPVALRGVHLLYFYVPKGTKVVGGFTSGPGNGNTQVHDGDGNQVFVMSDVPGGNGYFSIPVANGQDGKLWSLQRATGTHTLMTVPPYLARNEKELLLPKEVVEADK